MRNARAIAHEYLNSQQFVADLSFVVDQYTLHLVN